MINEILCNIGRKIKFWVKRTLGGQIFDEKLCLDDT